MYVRETQYTDLERRACRSSSEREKLPRVDVRARKGQRELRLVACGRSDRKRRKGVSIRMFHYELKPRGSVGLWHH